MKRRNFLSFASILCLTSVLCFNCQQQEQKTIALTSFSPEKEIELDSFLHQLQQTFPIPGLAVAIIHDNQVLYKSVGLRDQAAELPLTDSTPFFMGNISELMTATGVVKLAQSGKIKLDDPVSKYLPYFTLGDTVRHEIQIRHLLTHTSGVPHHDAVWDLPTYDATALAFTTTSVSRQPPEFKPAGSRVKRSQYNYDILADLIEKASGMRFEDYMNKEVLQPLGMKHSVYYDTAIQGKNDVAQPHKIDNWLTYNLAKETLYPQNREHAGSIGFHATAEDITTWMAMLLNEGNAGGKQFIDKDLHKELFSAHYKTGANTYVGFGWEIRKHDSLTFFTKNHYIGGFSADITLLPEQHTGVMVMSNVSEEFDPSVITDQIIQWLSGRKFDSPKIPVNVVMGRALNENHSLDKTLALYNDLKQQYPDRYDFSHAALSKLGINLMHRLQRKEDAIRVFDFILQQHPSSPYAHLNLAEAYVVNNNIAKAEEQLKIVKEMSPSPEAVKSHLTYLEETIGIMKEEKHEMPTSLE
jgi:CubicO group peptidase (beta-lactamase class C family)